MGGIAAAARGSAARLAVVVAIAAVAYGVARIALPGDPLGSGAVGAEPIVVTAVVPAAPAGEAPFGHPVAQLSGRLAQAPQPRAPRRATRLHRTLAAPGAPAGRDEATTPARTSRPAGSAPTPTAPAPAAPRTATPPGTTPTATVPNASPPAPTTPAATTPAATTPATTAPSVTTPAVTTPAATVPSVTTPTVETPVVTVPPVTTPAVTTPAVTVPSL